MSKPNIPLFLFKMMFLSFLLTTALLLLLSFFLFQFKWDTSVTKIGVYVIYFLSCFLPALLTGKKMRSRRLLWGLAISALYVLLFFLVSGFFGTGLLATPNRLFLVLGICLLGGIFGGVAS